MAKQIKSLKAKSAIIQDEFKAFEISWQCNKGHINFQTIYESEMDKIQNDVCLKCMKHYHYNIDK